MRCSAWPPRKIHHGRETAREAPRQGFPPARGAGLPHCRPLAPLAHLVERRTFNPVGRVRVPHGAFSATGRLARLPADRARVRWDVDGMLAKRGEWNDLEGMLIGGGEHHVAGGAVQVRSKPVGSGHAPAVPGVQPGEAIPRQRGAQIVADALLMLEELRGYDGADLLIPPTSSRRHRNRAVVRLARGSGTTAPLMRPETVGR